MTDEEVVRRLYPHAHCVTSAYSHRGKWRIRSGNDPYRDGRIYLCRFCKTPERAWAAAAESVTTRELSRMDE